jgi:hypothetical protein
MDTVFPERAENAENNDAHSSAAAGEPGPRGCKRRSDRDASVDRLRKVRLLGLTFKSTVMLATSAKLYVHSSKNMASFLGHVLQISALKEVSHSCLTRQIFPFMGL